MKKHSESKRSTPVLQVDIPQAAIDDLSEVAFALGALGVEQRDAHTMLPGSAAEGEVRLLAYFADGATRDRCATLLGTRLHVDSYNLHEEDWREVWKRFFRTQRFGRLVLHPSWEAPEIGPDEVALCLDPEHAFGSGRHESTRLVLGLLAGMDLCGQEVLDLGTGSGILGLAALKLGAAAVVAVDTDAAAVDVALRNAALSGVEARFAAHAVGPSPDFGERRWPIVLANIESRVLIPKAGAISRCLGAGAELVLSGLLAEEHDAVRAAYPELALRQVRTEGAWIAMHLQRRQAGCDQVQHSEAEHGLAESCRKEQRP